MVLTDSEIESINIAKLVAGGACSLCCLLVITVYCVFKELHFFYMRLVIFMIFSNLIFAVSTMIIATDGPACYISAVVNQFGVLSETMWALLITLALYIGIARQNREIEKKNVYFIIAGYGFPAVVAALPAAFDLYGLAGGWCWINVSRNFQLGSIFRIVCYYGPFYIVFFSVCVLYCKIVYTINKLLEGFDSENHHHESLYKIMLYPFILLFCSAPITVLRFMEIFGDYSSEYTISLVGIIIRLSSGIFNCVVYGLNGSVKQAFRNYFKRRKTRSSSLSSKLSMERYSYIFSTF